MHTIGDREYYEKLPLPDIGTHEIAFSDFVRYLIGSLWETAASLLPSFSDFVRYLIGSLWETAASLLPSKIHYRETRTHSTELSPNFV